MKNAELAKLFEHVADVLAVLGENVFRVNAYKKIARTLDEMPGDIEALAKTESLEDVPGIGKASAEKIGEYLRTGKVREFEDIFGQVPAGVMEIMRIPTVGPKTVAILWNEGGVNSLEKLKAKIEDGSLIGLPGIGAKKLEKIKENMAFLATSAGRIRIGEALPIAVELVEFLKSVKDVKNAQYCGSLRRGKETIGDVDIAVAAEETFAAAINEALRKHQVVAQIIQSGPSKTSFRTSAGLQVDVRIVPPESFGAAVQYFTGSKEHNVRVREIAVKKGLKINEWGVFKVKGEKEERIGGATEEEIYDAIGLATVPPEMREDRGEVEWAIEQGTSTSGGRIESELERFVSKLPQRIPSGNSAADAIHRQYRPEILRLLDIGYSKYLPKVRWVDMGNSNQELVDAFEAALVGIFDPPLNSQKLMRLSVAEDLISRYGAQQLYKEAQNATDWVSCDNAGARARALKSIPKGKRGVYLFKAGSSGWTQQQLGYIGKAAVGKAGSSDIRYRIKDHFDDESRADNFPDKFLQLLRSFVMRESPQCYAIELVELADIRGDLHMHTVASDGVCSIEEMVAECKRRGYQYCAITDHSKSQFQANGLKVDRLMDHIKAIHAVAKEAERSGILVLAGSEVDILADGSLDYEDDVLAKLDWVVASPHAALTQESDAATQRLVRAAANPHVCVIGHPTGRIVPSRRGLEPDMQKVIFAAARNGIALEINANCYRLDLRDTHVKMAVDANVPICINTDAHGIPDFDQMIYGVLTARRGWATAAHILNARPLAEFKSWLKGRKEAAAW